MADELAQIHAAAKQQFNEIQGTMKDEREQCLGDRRFYSIAGAQWEGDLSDQFANKPKFEFNKIHLSVIRIINEYRNNRVTVDFLSKTKETDGLADLCDGLYRADEQDCGAEEAYDNAFEEAVGGGIGAWRMRAAYEDDENEDNEHQRIAIEPIFDADSTVYFDLDAKRQDKKDAKHCFVMMGMTPDAYREEYGDDPSTWAKVVDQSEFDWNTVDIVYIAEYYVKEETSEKVYVYKGLDEKETRYRESDFEADDTLKAMLKATGSKMVRSRSVKTRKVHKYIMNGDKVLEDCGYIAGPNIPIVMVYGKRWFVDGIERAMGHVRLAKDAQRLKNMQASKLAEISALNATEKPVFLPEQMTGHQQMWEEDNIKDFPYLLVNPITGPEGESVPAGAISYTKPPIVPPALGALLGLTEQDMNDLLGNQQMGEQLNANTSGKAVELVQNRLDMQSFIYMSNFSKGMQRAGEIWLGMAKELYTEEGRHMKSLDESGKAEMVELMMPALDEKGVEIVENDLTKSNFDVLVDVGPSSSSKRAATVQALTGMMAVTTDPETLQVLNAMSMMNMEGEGLSDVREYFRKKLVAMGASEPTNEDREEMEAQGQQPDPNAEYLAGLAEEAKANAAKARADTFKTVADAGKAEADTKLKEVQAVEIMAGIELDEQKLALEQIKTVSGAPQEPSF